MQGRLRRSSLVSHPVPATVIRPSVANADEVESHHAGKFIASSYMALMLITSPLFVLPCHAVRTGDSPMGQSISQILMLTGPLLDDMLVSRDHLPFLVRETCINVQRKINSIMVMIPLVVKFFLCTLLF